MLLLKLIAVIYQFVIVFILFLWNCHEQDARDSIGVTVLHGNYNIKLHFGNETASETIKVSYDPRVEMPFEVLKNKYDLLKQLEDKMDDAGKATQHLLESKEIVEDYQKRIKAQKKNIKIFYNLIKKL